LIVRTPTVWVACHGVACPRVADGGHEFRIWSVAAVHRVNIVGQSIRCSLSAWGLGRGAKSTSP